jgi:hydrogenase maturation protease
MKTIVLGLGNPILSDDGVGWEVVRQVERLLLLRRSAKGGGIETDFDYLSVGGLRLMEHLVGYDRAILVDAIQTGSSPPGIVSCFPLTSLPDWTGNHLGSAHDTTLVQAIKVGRMMGVNLPDIIDVVGIESNRTYEFSEELTQEVAAAVPEAVQIILNMLE